MIYYNRGYRNQTNISRTDIFKLDQEFYKGITDIKVKQIVGADILW